MGSFLWKLGKKYVQGYGSMVVQGLGVVRHGRPMYANLTLEVVMGCRLVLSGQGTLVLH